MTRPRRRHYAFAAIVLLLIGFLVTSFRVTVVHGDSMLPTYKSGQMVIVNRLSRGHQRGDVVLVEAGNEVLIKRIAYLAGDEMPADHAWMFGDVAHYFEATQNQNAPLKVPAGHVVVLGDNPNVSDDSRSFGPVPIDQIYGRVVNAPSRPGQTQSGPLP
jgi:signal peptidase I